MIRRRDFITLLGGAAAAWPVAARAQQPAMPVIGLLRGAALDNVADELRAFRQGLKQAGYIEGDNVAIEYRAAGNQIDRLPDLAADLIRRRVALIVATDNASARAAKEATTIVPVAFLVGGDPVGLGLVASLARPGGNLTGVNFFATELVAKRLELLRELTPSAARIAVLVNPSDTAVTESVLKDVGAAARSMRVQIHVIEASTNGEINAAFAGLARERPDGLFVGPGPFFTARRVQLTHLATLHRIPAIYSGRQTAEAGGLMSYGANVADAWRQVGVYAGRILKGAKPADLPVEQSTKVELVINLQTARALGLEVPATLLARADEVIE
jgi:putative tryptophan/tyrosine transport system substrate-binding protein